MMPSEWEFHLFAMRALGVLTVYGKRWGAAVLGETFWPAGSSLARAAFSFSYACFALAPLAGSEGFCS